MLDCNIRGICILDIRCISVHQKTIQGTSLVYLLNTKKHICTEKLHKLCTVTSSLKPPLMLKDALTVSADV